MRLTVVGSGTAAPDPERACAAFFLESPHARVLLDCGPGAVHHMARFGVPWPQLDHLVVSHFHNDHTGDIPALLFALKWGVAERRTRPLRLWGPAGLRDRLDHMAAAFGEHVVDPDFPVDVTEIGPGGGATLATGLELAAAATPHSEVSLAFRIHATDGPTLGYTGDTGASDDVARFLADVDLLVAECSVPDDEAMDNHLTPSRLAAMARIAGPALLLVTHVYPNLGRHDVAALIRHAGWSGDIVRAVDGLQLEIGTSSREHTTRA